MTMSTDEEEPPSSKNSSPRLSFSNDLNQYSSPPRKVLCKSSSFSDFEFLVKSQDPVPADEIFSEGKILPLPLKNPNHDPNPIPKPAAAEKKPPRWKFGRSSSLNFGGGGRMIMRMKFLRSKSVGSEPNPIPNRKSIPKPPRRAKSCKTYRSSGPVPPFFPKERSGMGVIGFLLCSCGDKKMTYYSSP